MKRAMLFFDNVKFALAEGVRQARKHLPRLVGLRRSQTARKNGRVGSAPA